MALAPMTKGEPMTNPQRHPCHGVLAAPATLAAPVSVHWIVCKDPMGGMAYGHACWRGQRLAQSKNKHRIFYLDIY